MKNSKHGEAPRGWERLFSLANIQADELAACKSSHAKAVKIGKFLSPNVGREVPIEVGGRTGRAVLRVVEARAKEKRYFFEVSWDSSAAPATDNARSRPGARTDGVPTSADPSEAKTLRKRTKKAVRGSKSTGDKPIGKPAESKNHRRRDATACSGASESRTWGEAKDRHSQARGRGNDEPW